MAVTDLSGTEPEPEPEARMQTGTGTDDRAAGARLYRSRRPPRGRVLAVAVTVLLTAGGGAALLWTGGGKEGNSASEQGPEVTTVAVARTDLSDVRQLEGTLGFGASRTVRGAGGGKVTWLPAAGAVVKRGKQLYRVDDRPAVVFYGSTPMYRRLDTPNSVGRDVRVVADNLTALGYDIGAQPAPGSTVRPKTPASAASSFETPTAADSSVVPDAPDAADASEAAPDSSEAGRDTEQPADEPSSSSRPVTVKEGDGVLTPSLIAAIKRWQPSAGMEATGVLGIGDVVVTEGTARVGRISATLGDEASADLLTISATTKTVTVPVDTLDAGSVKKGQKVSVTLPDQSMTPGRVARISTIIQAADEENDGAGSPQRLSVTITLDDAHAVRGIDTAKVEVRFATQTRNDVLTVPVGALLALSEGGYAVRSPAGKLFAVETGLFAKGLVEVGGSGIAEGMKVETTS